MPREPIPDDATIADVINRLDAPETYVREVLGHMWPCWKQHGDASVRIAVTGKGHAPHYRIEYPNAKVPSDPIVFEVYRGSGHREFRELGEGQSVRELLADGALKPKPTLGRDRAIFDPHWSSRALRFDEIRDLLRNQFSKGAR